ncbi:Cadherin [Flavobacterium longum]|uniref:PQQ-dependent sugar dehydrogenase n=1 Tax=Flavobacterium longum TaxID=1299340 RepID=UPI0039EC2791
MKKLFLSVGFFGLLCSAQNIQIVPFATDFNYPVEITTAGDDRLFVVEKEGLIKVLNADGTVNSTPFLTMPEGLLNTMSDRGLLGMAFHPNYAANGYFYVYYTNGITNSVELSRYSVSADPNIADAGSQTVLVTIPHPFFNHYGGTIKFGADGYLYISIGDGGDGGARAQNIQESLGKIIRIDVDATAPYIPAGNPFVGADGNDEIWAMGVRNPWKFSFDKQTGDLWIADVGELSQEEVNKISAPLPSGLNFGWPCYEGTLPYNTAECSVTAMLTAPFAVYGHSQGCSVIGGYVYRGSIYESLTGKYLFTDFCRKRIGIISEAGTISYTPDFETDYAFITFGQDSSGELYIATGATIYKIIDADLSTTDQRATLASVAPNPAHSFLNIRNTSGKTLDAVSIYDVSGKLLHQQKLGESDVETVSINLSAGLYIVQITDATGGRQVSKITVN